MKAFTNDKSSVAKTKISAFHVVENIVGKGENGGYQHFFPLPAMSLQNFFLRLIKTRDCVLKREAYEKFCYFSI